MATNFNIEEFSSEKLNSGFYQDLLPDIYNLKQVVENGPWHLKQDVFSHTVRVVAEMELILSGSSVLSDLSEEVRVRVEERLNQKIDNLTIRQLLIIVSLMHDIGKDVTIIYLPDGSAKCPGHEAEGARRVAQYQQKLSLTSDQTAFVLAMVRDHDYGHQAAELSLTEGVESALQRLNTQRPEVFDDLVLFTIADMRGSDLAKSNLSEFEQRQKNLIEFLIKK